MAKKTTTPQQTTAEHNHDHHDHDHGHDHHHHGGVQHPLLTEGRTLDLTIPWETVQAAIQKVVVKYQPYVKTDGFRKGKVPAKIVIDMIGQQRLYEEAAEQFLPQAYIDAVKSADAKPLSNPDIHAVEMTEGQDWKFHAHIAEYPEITLGDYKKDVKKALKELDAELKKQAKDKKDDKEVSAEDKEKEEAKQKDQRIDRILGAIQQSVNPKIPELLVRQEVNRQLNNLERQLKQLNIDPAQYLKSVGRSVEELQQEYAAQAIATWQLEFILDTIAKEEKIEATDAEVEDMMKASKEKLSKEEAEEQKAQVRHMLKKQKVVEFLQQL